MVSHPFYRILAGRKLSQILTTPREASVQLVELFFVLESPASIINHTDHCVNLRGQYRGCVSNTGFLLQTKVLPTDLMPLVVSLVVAVTCSLLLYGCALHEGTTIHGLDRCARGIVPHVHAIMNLATESVPDALKKVIVGLRKQCVDIRTSPDCYMRNFTPLITLTDSFAALRQVKVSGDN